MAGLFRTHLLVAVFGIILRNTFAQDSCGSADHFALYVHNDGNNDGTDLDGIFKATAPFDSASDFSKLPLETTENPTAVFKDVVEDYVYWAGNNINTGRYIKRDVKTGGTTQDQSLVTCSPGTALGMADETIANNEIFASGTYNDGSNNAHPHNGRLNKQSDVGPPDNGNNLGAWIPASSTNPYIAVNLLGRPVITGIKTQGRQDADMWTTKYNVYYSNEAVGIPGVTISPADPADWMRHWRPVLGADGAEFTGNVDRNTEVIQYFNEPIVALYIAIVPIEWETSIMDLPALRFELLGCQVPQCTAASGLGVEDGSIHNSQLSQSSGTASDGRLNAGTTWVAAASDTTPNVVVFLGGRAMVTGITIQGNGQAAATKVVVTELQVDYSQDNGNTWYPVTTTPTSASPSAALNAGATASTGESDPLDVNFDRPLSATHIRIRPLKTIDDGTIGEEDTETRPAQMRFEVNGCREPEITHLAVDGTCGSRKVYWTEYGRDSIFYANLEATTPTQQTLLTDDTIDTIVDIELNVESGHIYYAEQDSASTASLIKRATLTNGNVVDSVTVSSTNGNIQSIAIDWDTDRVYYSINPDAGNSGSIGYVDLSLGSNTEIYTVTPSPDPVFYPYDIGVYGEYVYALEDEDSIVRVPKSLSGSVTATTNTIETHVDSFSFARLARDLHFVKCIDYPNVTIESTKTTYYESDSRITLNIARQGDLRCCSSVNLVITEDTATYLAKYSDDFSIIANAQVTTSAGSPPVVTFSAGEDSITVEYLIAQDNNVVATVGEGDEKFLLALEVNDCAAVEAGTEFTIKDSYSCYYIDPDDDSYAVLEGDQNQVHSINILRMGQTLLEGTVNVVYDQDTAKTTEDFSYVNHDTSIDFAVGSDTATAQVTIIGDDDVEELEVERFHVQLRVPSGATNAKLCPGEVHEAYVTITDNDFVVALRETHITARENENDNKVHVPVCRSGYMGDAAITVKVTVNDISAVQGSDYVSVGDNYMVTFMENQECTYAEIILINDEEGEPNEAFEVILSDVSRGKLGNTRTVVGTSDDDTAIKIEFGEYSITEEGSMLPVKLIREGALESDENVIFVALSGTATAGEDFVDFEGIVFEAGDEEKTVYINIIDDALDEPSETFTLKLVNTEGEDLSLATVTILDNDEPVADTQQRYYFDRSSLRIDEDVGYVQVAVIRTRTETSGSVKVITTDGTATSGRDFIQLSSSDPEAVAEFAEGSGRATVTIAINDDDEVEEDESFTAQLSEQSDGLISDGNIFITIVDNDDEEDPDDDGDGDGDGDVVTLSTAALIGIILGAVFLLLTVLGLAVCGCCFLLRQSPPPRGGLYPPPPPGYGPRYRPPPAYAARDNRGFRPV